MEGSTASAGELEGNKVARLGEADRLERAHGPRVDFVSDAVLGFEARLVGAQLLRFRLG